MLDLNIPALRAIAEAATPGPWEPYETVQADNAVTAGGGLLTGTIVCGPTYERRNVAHIATFDPPTVLVLLDRLERSDKVISAIESLRLKWNEDPAYPITKARAGHQLHAILQTGQDDGARVERDPEGERDA